MLAGWQAGAGATHAFTSERAFRFLNLILVCFHRAFLNEFSVFKLQLLNENN
jgi:hypothetical protein